MTAANAFVKLPQPTDISLTYPWVDETQWLCGRHEFVGSAPGAECHSEFHPYGTGEQTNFAGDRRELFANKKHEFVSNGHAVTSEAAHDHTPLGGMDRRGFGGLHEEWGGHSTHAYGSQVIQASNGHVSRYIGGNFYKGHGGDVVTAAEHSNASHYEFTSSDSVKIHGNNYYRQIGGECGWFLPGGNMDTLVANGQYQVHSGQAMTHKSDTVVTIQAGNNTSTVIANTTAVSISATSNVTVTVGQSTVTVTSSSITITSAGDITLNAQGKINLTATGDITTQGATTKIQSGGTAAAPATFT